MKNWQNQNRMFRSRANFNVYQKFAAKSSIDLANLFWLLRYIGLQEDIMEEYANYGLTFIMMLSKKNAKSKIKRFMIRIFTENQENSV